MYGIANRRSSTRIVGLPLVFETPLRTGNLRDPNGPQVTFAYESFIDELAVAAKADPVRFRLALMAESKEDNVFRKARSIAVTEAAAKAYGWETRPSPRPRAAALKGSGFDIGWTDGDLGQGKTFVCKDPDGHVSELYYETEWYEAPPELKPSLKNQAQKFPGRAATCAASTTGTAWRPTSPPAVYSSKSISASG